VFFLLFPEKISLSKKQAFEFNFKKLLHENVTLKLS